MPFRNKKEKLDEWHQTMLNLVKSRDHQLISGKITTHQREECYVVYCPKHDHSTLISYFNYKRSRTGCLWCGRDSVSKRLTGREFSEETIERMSVSAKTRPDRGGKPRRWRETHDYRVWNSLVRQDWSHSCAITGIKNNTPGDGLLVVHHLISASSSEALALTVENGILIHNKLHTAFHLAYGYRNNTVEQFMDFIQKRKNNEIDVPISSQGEPGGSQGSETRVYDPERIMKLHERLSEVKDILETSLTAEEL
jgi:hypothetical protein